MRTRLFALAAATLGLMTAGLGVAQANNVPTPVGTLGVMDGNGYIVVFDAMSPLPVTGYVGVTEMPWCAAFLFGGPYEEGPSHTPLQCQLLLNTGVPVPVAPPGTVPPLPVPVPLPPP